MPHVCPRCGEPVTGRADRIYCPGRCRRAASEARMARKRRPRLTVDELLRLATPTTKDLERYAL